jgi:hypothetical protein
MQREESQVGRRTLNDIAALIACDQGAPGFRGKLAMGVRDDEGELWLAAEMSDRAVAKLEASADETATVRLLLGEAEFRTLVSTGAPPANPALLELSGDVAVLSRFLQRYLVPKSAVAIRTSTPTSKSARMKKRR